MSPSSSASKFRLNSPGRQASPRPTGAGSQRAASPRGTVGGSLFERDPSRRSPAGRTTGAMASEEPAFIFGQSPSGKRGATHPSKFGEVVFNKQSPASTKHDLNSKPEFKGRLGITSAKYGLKDPLLSGETFNPAGNESKSATTWKSQVDDILYGADIDGSGDAKAMMKAVENAPQYKGAAGMSSLAKNLEAPDHRVDVNTRIDTTYAIDAGVGGEGLQPGEAVRMPERVARGHQNEPSQLFSKAGVSGWTMNARGEGLAPGKDENWRPWHKAGAFFYSG